MKVPDEERLSLPLMPIILLVLSLVVVLWMAQSLSFWGVCLLAVIETAKVVCMVAVLAGIKNISRDL